LHDWGVSTITLGLFGTLTLATVLFFAGQLLVQASTVLQRYSIPVPVVGGVLFALAMAAVGLVAGVQLVIDESLKDPLLLAFFATLGLGADVRSLARGGWKLVILLLLFVVLMVMQCAVGVGLARVLDLHPLVGLLGGSISLIGGHGTAAAYAASFADTRNICGAMGSILRRSGLRQLRHRPASWGARCSRRSRPSSCCSSCWYACCALVVPI
jgi:ESS family glutamate:Na+ symporter